MGTEEKRIRPLYSEFQGYLSQAPPVKETYDSMDDEAVWNQYNDAVDSLTKISGTDYGRFRIEPQTGEYEQPFIRLLTYRQKLGGLIMTLHGEYFSKEPAPFSGAPSTVMSQVQQQGQAVHFQMVLEIQSRIDEMIPKHKEGSKERGFLEKVKGSLPAVSNIAQLVVLFFKTAKECGIGIDDVLKVFG